MAENSYKLTRLYININIVHCFVDCLNIAVLVSFDVFIDKVFGSDYSHSDCPFLLFTKRTNAIQHSS